MEPELVSILIFLHTIALQY